MSGHRSAHSVLRRCLRGDSEAWIGSGHEDWAAVFQVANDQLLTPALFCALAEAGQLSRLPAEAADYLATLHRLNARRNRTLRAQAIELVAALNERGVVPLLLKGGLALFEGPYADPAQRMMRDLDILVPADERERAVTALRALGYRLSRQYPSGHHAVGDFARPHDPGSVDLHTELVDPSYVLPAIEVRARASVKELDGARFLAPCPTDRIMHNVLHAQIHFLGHFYRGELLLQQVHELVVMARHFGEAIDWSFVEGRLGEHRLTTALESYLLAAHRLLGLAWPLPKPPCAAAVVHYWRCQLQHSIPGLHYLGVPWGNLRAAFAWHRMRALHGDAGGPVRWRYRHLLHYVQRKGLGAAVSRMLRAV